MLVPGDEIEVVSCHARDLHLGDIVLFAARDASGALAGLVVHRLLLDREEGLIARGDGATSVDPIWSRDSVLGVVTTRFRNGIEFRLAPRRRTLGGRVRALGWELRTGVLGAAKRRVIGGGSRKSSRSRGGQKRVEIDPAPPLNLRFPPKENESAGSPTLPLDTPPPAQPTVELIEVTPPQVPSPMPDLLKVSLKSSKPTPKPSVQSTLPATPKSTSQPVQQSDRVETPPWGPPPASVAAPLPPKEPPSKEPQPSESPPKVAATATPPSRPTRPARERRRRRRGGFTWNPIRYVRRLARR